ncbi:glutamate--tRNA ligase family protein [Candidatus Vidania fulgoroideorum]
MNTRFSPEPGGFLHIGHLKMIFINIKIVKIKKGKFILRFDDTNPKVSKLIYISSIIRNLKYINIYNKLTKLTFTSDYFDDLLKIAFLFIKNNYAVVEKNKIILSKKKSKFEFLNMKNGKYKNDVNTNIFLISKISIKTRNYNVKNNVMYRILKRKHFKSKYYIYPTYNFSHCLCDKIENVKYSICSKEFENNNFIYSWYLNKYKKILNKKKNNPKQIEISKLIIKNVSLSKRKIKKYMKYKKIKWNDFYLPTISCLENKKINYNVILDFLKKISFSKKNSFSIINFNIKRKSFNLQYLYKIKYKIYYINNGKINMLFLKKKESKFFSKIYISLNYIFLVRNKKILFNKVIKLKTIYYLNKKKIFINNFYKKKKYFNIGKYKFIKKDNYLVKI